MSGDDREDAIEQEPLLAQDRHGVDEDGDDLDDGDEGDGGDDGGEGGGGGDDGDEPGPSLDEVDVKNLLRAALKPPAEDPNRIKKGVQKKIREASGGRFFGDGWSTATAPRETYLVTGILMLILVALAWLALGPRF
jgi:hypothetical protein